MSIESCRCVGDVMSYFEFHVYGNIGYAHDEWIAQSQVAASYAIVLRPYD